MLTNSLLAIIHFLVFLGKIPNWFGKRGIRTALITSIVIVGLVYQFVLYATCCPEGWVCAADEPLHSAIPLIALIYWLLEGRKERPQYRDIG